MTDERGRASGPLRPLDRVQVRNSVMRGGKPREVIEGTATLKNLINSGTGDGREMWYVAFDGPDPDRHYGRWVSAADRIPGLTPVGGSA